MNFKEGFRSKINTLESEHLNKGVKPIMGGVYDRNNLDRETEYFLDDFKKNAEFVNFEYSEEDLKKNEILNGGKNTYLISRFDNKDKYSTSFLDCTGMVVSWIDKNTGEKMSFLTHQNYSSFVEDNKEILFKFKGDINKSLDFVSTNAIPGTVDVAIFGGNDKEDEDSNSFEDFQYGRSDIDDFAKEKFFTYKKSISLLNNIVSSKLGFSPVVIEGPNENFDTTNHGLSVYFDNRNRRLYLLRAKNNSVNNEEFIADNLDEQIRKINGKK